MQMYCAKADRQCGKCRGKIAKGSAYYGYRERALSHHEALHAGTQYPKRYVCKSCGDKHSRPVQQLRPT